MSKKEEEKAAASEARVNIWKYVFGFTEMAVVKCAIELGIADVLENSQGPMTVLELSGALGCSPSTLYRIMRFLIHRSIFKEMPITTSNNGPGSVGYIQTPLSRLLRRQTEDSMAAFVLLESSPIMLAPWHQLSSRVLANGTSAFEAAHGEDVWHYAAENPGHNKLINEAMACDARVAMTAIIDACIDIFHGLSSVVDVGGADGTALRALTKACPWIRGINFDLPHVISVAPQCHKVQHVGGDMFHGVPKADAAFLMWVLHDWGDDECIHILKNCKEAIPQETGKIIIIEIVIEEKEGNKLKDVNLMLDMVMLAHTNKGKERTLEEWTYILREAGFTHHTVKHIEAIQSVIEAYP